MKYESFIELLIFDDIKNKLSFILKHNCVFVFLLLFLFFDLTSNKIPELLCNIDSAYIITAFSFGEILKFNVSLND